MRPSSVAVTHMPGVGHPRTYKSLVLGPSFDPTVGAGTQNGAEGLQHDQRLVGKPGRAPLSLPPHPPRLLQFENLASPSPAWRRAEYLPNYLDEFIVRFNGAQLPWRQSGRSVSHWQKPRHTCSAKIVGLKCPHIYSEYPLTDQQFVVFSSLGAKGNAL